MSLLWVAAMYGGIGLGLGLWVGLELGFRHGALVERQRARQQKAIEDESRGAR